MNLVKAQEYAASLPLAELKKYADGLNPSMIPPWLATGEMEAKTKRMEMANNLQGAAKGQQPSIKEQVEKKAGLMALQQAQLAQQQGMQQSPQPGGPVPEGTPEPEQQPQQQPGLDQLQSNIQMAGGGIVAFAGPTGSEVKAGPEFMKFLQKMGLDYVEYSNSAPNVKSQIQELFQEFKTAPTAAAQTGEAAPAAAGKAFQLGQKAAPILKAIKSGAVPAAAGVAGAGLAAYEGLSDVDKAKGFYDDPNVSMLDKAKQFSRTAANVAAPTVGGIVGSGIAPVAGTIGGAAAGAGIAALYNKLLDQFGGNELEAWKAAQAISQKDNQSPAETARLNATRPAADMGNEGRRTTPVGEGIGANVSPNLIPANLRPAAKPPVAASPNAPRPNAPTANTAPAAPDQNSMDALFRQSLENKPPERKIEDLIAEQNAIRAGTGLGEEAGKAKLERIGGIDQLFKNSQMTPAQEIISMLGKAGQYKGFSGFAPAYIGIEEAKNAAKLKHAKDINELMGGVEDTQRAEKVGIAGKVQSAREKDVENAALFGRDKLKTLEGARGQDIQSQSSKYVADMHYKAAMAQMHNANIRQDMQEKRMLLDTFKNRIAAIDRELVPLEKSMMPKDKDLAAQYRAEKAGLTKALDEASGISKIAAAPSAASPSGTRPPLSSFQR